MRPTHRLPDDEVEVPCGARPVEDRMRAKGRAECEGIGIFETEPPVRRRLSSASLCIKNSRFDHIGNLLCGRRTSTAHFPTFSFPAFVQYHEDCRAPLFKCLRTGVCSSGRKQPKPSDEVSLSFGVGHRCPLSDTFTYDSRAPQLIGNFHNKQFVFYQRKGRHQSRCPTRSLGLGLA